MTVADLAAEKCIDCEMYGTDRSPYYQNERIFKFKLAVGITLGGSEPNFKMKRNQLNSRTNSMEIQNILFASSKGGFLDVSRFFATSISTPVTKSEAITKPHQRRTQKLV